MSGVEGVITALPDGVLDAPGWGNDQAELYFERLGIGDGLGMSPEEAERVARREAGLSLLAGTPPESRAPVLRAMEVFGATIVGIATKPAAAAVAPVQGEPKPEGVPTPTPPPRKPPAAPTSVPEPEPSAPAPVLRPAPKPITVSVSDDPPGLFPGFRKEEGYGTHR